MDKRRKESRERHRRLIDVSDRMYALLIRWKLGRPSKMCGRKRKPEAQLDVYPLAELYRKPEATQ